jgi:hypothetical protein
VFRAHNPRLIGRYLALLATAYVVCIIAVFINRGPNLDEFWTMWMTDPHLGMIDAYRQRWSTDLHPPFYYFLVWSLRHLTDHDYVYTRLVNIFPFAIFLPALALWKQYRGLDPWLATYLTVIASSPFFLANTVDLRSYYALTVLGICLVMLTRIGRSLPGDVTLRDKPLIGLSIMAILIALNIHYAASLMYLILLSIEMLKAVQLRKYRWAAILFAATFFAGIMLLTGLSVTLRTTHNFSYLPSGVSRFIAFIVGGVAVSTIANLGADIAIVRALFRGRLGAGSAWGWSLATLCAVSLALFLQSLINNAMSLNYVMVLVPIGSAFIADLVATEIFSSTLLIAMLGLSAIASQATTAVHEYDNGRWMRYSDKLRQIKRDCPTTQFIGVDQNALPEFAVHPAVSGYIGVFAEGYATVGHYSDVPFLVTSPARPITIKLDKCPLVLLSDHEVTQTQRNVPELLRDTRVSVSNYRSIVTYAHDYQRLFIFYP